MTAEESTSDVVVGWVFMVWVEVEGASIVLVGRAEQGLGLVTIATQSLPPASTPEK